MIDDQIARRVRIIRRIYLGLACLAALSLTSQFTPPLRSDLQEYAGNTLIFVFIYGAAYIGLVKQLNWVIPLLLITSIYVLIQTLFTILVPALTITAFVAKIVQFIVLFFYWYQAFFFSRHEVKQYFGSKGTILF